MVAGMFGLGTPNLLILLFQIIYNFYEDFILLFMS